METVTDFIFLGSKITADGDCSHEIKRCLLLGRKATTNLKVKVKSLSRVRLFATPWTVAHHAPLSMGFSRQEYWSGLPLRVMHGFPKTRLNLVGWVNLGEWILCGSKVGQGLVFLSVQRKALLECHFDDGVNELFAFKLCIFALRSLVTLVKK